MYIKKTDAQYIEVLVFKQKVLIFDMGSVYDLVRKKKIIYNLNCSVVLDLGCKEAKEGYYTIEDLLKGNTKQAYMDISKEKEVSFFCNK
ncbi:MAG: hypothetical protein HFH68_15765 [Lachnospiraceae bacterium]|nr:hypothetical protein [Lachnospiraceae bacterium]